MKNESEIVTRICELKERKEDIQEEYAGKQMSRVKRREKHNIQMQLKALYWVLDDAD